ncbi:hypothetical protein [Leptolyngbya sp. BL0902]|uniref:hypothetical protein n=1 Tax=Leptolyngbya sp. BL0902 TaxID=1115757 RepID=UPI0018E7356C|nr:hypothetical protein [Leptolyngbya sp. BL0902]
MTLSRSVLSPLRWATPRSLAGTVVACAVVLGLGLKAQANSSNLVILEQSPAIVETLAQAARSFPAPGQYLFGQSAEPDQIGHGYIAMESNGQDLYGALYFPGSSFDCFYGQVQGNALAMTIIDSYSEEAYPYSIALDPQSAIATEDLGTTTVPLNLHGFHALERLTDNDQRMLEVCRAEVAPELSNRPEQ